MSEGTHENPERAARLAVRTDTMLGIDVVLIASSPEPEAIMTPPIGSIHSPPVVQEATARSPLTPVSIDDSYFDSKASQETRLSKLEAHHQCSCTFCAPNASSRVLVFGEGSHDASLMFVGEAPGTEEERLGRPFVGRAGSKLDEMIKAMGLSREDVYITNALKSRPPDTRVTESDDFEQCGAFLAAQARIIKPDVIVALGGPASKLLLKSDMGITSLRGRWAKYNDGENDVAIMPTFHPAYLLRNPTLEVRGQIWTDLQEVMKRLGLSPPSRT
jgi:uracil-DNA glycosylase family 4